MAEVPCAATGCVHSAAAPMPRSRCGTHRSRPQALAWSLAAAAPLLHARDSVQRPARRQRLQRTRERSLRTSAAWLPSNWAACPSCFAAQRAYLMPPTNAAGVCCSSSWLWPAEQARHTPMRHGRHRAADLAAAFAGMV
eukprot:126355-Chlamydomonas_euryale.AAC.6